MTMSNTTANIYTFLFEEMADRRVDDWLMMKDARYPLMIIASYLFLIYQVLPKFMENRKPYDLRNTIQAYNLFQVLCCSVIIYGVSTSGWTTHLTLGCEPVDYSNDPMSLRLLSWVWWTMWLKLFEFSETLFFVLRKKMNQVTNLHMYHHTSTFMLGWLATKYIGGGMATFPIILNSLVHILMYSYYFLSSIGPTMQKRVEFIKPKLTMIQMIQFCILLAHASQAYGDQCRMPNLSVYMYIPNVLIIFSFFGNFYVQQYLKSSSRKVK